jgi:predicted lactoylglutathione lyase
MHKQIYVNLAVDNLERSKAFFSAIGLSFEPQFTNGQAACLILGIYAMLLVEPFFQTFTTSRSPTRREHRGAGVPVLRKPRRGRRW